MMTAIKIWVLLNMLILSVALARAQEQAAPRERALMERVSAEINNNLACATDKQTLMDRIRELEAKLKEKDKKP